MKTTSKRNYQLMIHEPVDGFHEIKISIDEIMFPEDKNAFEYIYALQEIVDDILDLPKGKSMYFSPDRDNKETLGIIVRTDL